MKQQVIFLLPSVASFQWDGVQTFSEFVATPWTKLNAAATHSSIMLCGKSVCVSAFPCTCVSCKFNLSQQDDILE
jgi:hypothetical protein